MDNMENQSTDNKNEKQADERIEDFGQVVLDVGNGEKKEDATEGESGKQIYLMTIIGEIEGHENAPGNSKTTKYEHVLPKLAELEASKDVGGLLVILNTQGGDVDAGLAIAEMIASLSIPTVSLVLGGSHSIGVPLAVSADYSFIVPTGTMLIHPVRMSGMVIGAPQTYDYFKRIQDRITGFISAHSNATQKQIEDMMMETGEMTKDLGRILVGADAVREGLIDEVGGMREAMGKLRAMMMAE